jgi:hypothetical protein
VIALEIVANLTPADLIKIINAQWYESRIDHIDENKCLKPDVLSRSAFTFTLENKEVYKFWSHYNLLVKYNNKLRWS